MIPFRTYLCPVGLKNRRLLRPVYLLLSLSLCLGFAPGLRAVDATLDFVYQGPGEYTGVHDTTLAGDYPQASYGGKTTLEVGGRFAPHKGLLRFDISSLKNAYTSITGATLKLRVNLKRGTWSNQALNVYRVAAANKTWSPGTYAYASSSENGAACWDYLSYTTILDPVTGLSGSTPWAGSAGLATATTDYVTSPVATATLSSTVADGTFITLTFTDLSFLADWINNPGNNSGFLLRIPGLEGENYSYVVFDSSEVTTSGNRPLLQVSVSGYIPPPSWSVSYSLANDAWVSLVIFDSAGNVVRELLHHDLRLAGANVDAWDGRDDSGTLVANGTYSWKLLSTQGVIASYQFSVGTNTPVKFDTWPGNHAAVPAIAVDSTGVYLASGEGEGPPLLVKIDASGNRIWTATIKWVDAWMGGWSLSADNGNLYLRQQDGKVKVFSSATAPSTPTASFNLLYSGSDSVDPNTGQRDSMDMCVRAGKMIVSYRDHNAIRWVNAATGATLQEIAVTGATGVTLTTDGATAYVCNDSTIYRFTYPSTTATVFKTYSTGVVPYRMDIDPRNNDLLIAFRGTDQKVRRYNSAGTATGVYGGPRIRNGAYVKTKFAEINDIAVAPDGSWWIAEPSAMPLRVAHINTNGTFATEFFGGQTYASFSTPDPADPTKVWLSHVFRKELVQATVDYTAKTWDVTAVYSFDHPLLPRLSFDNQGWQVLHRNGQTYLCFRKWPVVFRLNGSVLQACAIAGFANDGNGNWFIPADLRPASGSPRMFAWSDLNDDGIATLNEMTFDTRRIQAFAQSGAGSYVGDDFAYTGAFETGYQSLVGPGRLAPSGWTAGGAPIYSWSGLTYPTNGLPAAHYHQTAGYTRDAQGNYYGAYNLEWGAIGGANFGNGFWSPAVGGNQIVKWNSSGTRQWMVGRHSPNGGAEPGQMRYLWNIAGTAKDCVFVMDVEDSLVHIYDRDGLYVGRVFEEPAAGLPAEAYTLFAENFSGAVHENTTTGEVYYFGGSGNRSNVYKLTGWDSFVRKTGSVIKN